MVKAVQGKPAAALVELAEETGADVIVVGNKRVQGMSRVLGSIAADVTRRAPCDVYIAHTHDRRRA
ncbi:universal stress protein [Aeromicrobium sp. UC242_57]|uniref:universal stress protein n=1 Tax=Aeromicrobium sp. UC242_57 TaxID=3374624 RepID=UPI00378CC103